MGTLRSSRARATYPAVQVGDIIYPSAGVSLLTLPLDVHSTTNRRLNKQTSYPVTVVEERCDTLASVMTRYDCIAIPNAISNDVPEMVLGMTAMHTAP
jgi:hypothetical protein